MIAKDKIMHFLAGFFISFITYFVAFDYVQNIFQSILWGVFFALIIGALKEVFDKWFVKTGWSWLDIVATVFGGVIGSGTGILIVRLLQ